MNYVSPLTDGNKASAALACTISEIQSTKPAAKFCQLCVNSTANLRESEYISMQGTEGGRDFIPLRFAAAAPLLGAVVETIRDGVARQGPRTGTHSLRGKGPTGDQQGLQFASMVDRGGGPLGSHTTRTRSRTLPTSARRRRGALYKNMSKNMLAQFFLRMTIPGIDAPTKRGGGARLAPFTRLCPARLPDAA